MVPIAWSNVGFSRASVSYTMHIAGKRPYVQWRVSPACNLARIAIGVLTLVARRSPRPLMGGLKSPAAVPPEQARPEDSGWEFSNGSGWHVRICAGGARKPAFLRAQPDNARAPDEHDPSSEVRR